MAIQIIQLNSDFIIRFFFSINHKDIETLYLIFVAALLILLGVILFSIKLQDANILKKPVALLMPMSGERNRWPDYVDERDRIERPESPRPRPRSGPFDDSFPPQELGLEPIVVGPTPIEYINEQIHGPSSDTDLDGFFDGHIPPEEIQSIPESNSKGNPQEPSN